MSIVNRHQKERNIIAFVVKDHPDRTPNEHYEMYLNINYDDQSAMPKPEFMELRKQIIKEQKQKKFQADNIRLEYHITTKFVDYHMDSLDLLSEQIDWFKERWREESRREEVNMFQLTRISRMLNELITLRGQYNLGTPVVMFLLNKMNNEMSGGSGGNKVMSIVEFNKLHAANMLEQNSNEPADGNSSNKQVSNADGQHNELSGIGQNPSTEHSSSSVSSTGSIDIQATKDRRSEEALF